MGIDHSSEARVSPLQCKCAVGQFLGSSVQTGQRKTGFKVRGLKVLAQSPEAYLGLDKPPDYRSSSSGEEESQTNRYGVHQAEATSMPFERFAPLQGW
jgi:hypothetical protein